MARHATCPAIAASQRHAPSTVSTSRGPPRRNAPAATQSAFSRLPEGHRAGSGPGRSVVTGESGDGIAADDLRLDSRRGGPRKVLGALPAAPGAEAAGVGKTWAAADQCEHRGASCGRGLPEPLWRLGRRHDRGRQPPWRGRHPGRAEVGMCLLLGKVPEFAGGDRPPGRRPNGMRTTPATLRKP